MINHKGITWINYHGALVPDVAPHVEIDTKEGDVKTLLKETGVHFLRWHTSFDCPRETAFWHVIKDSPWSLPDFNKNTRNQIKKGLKNCTVERIEPQNLVLEGYQVYLRAMRSYRTDLKVQSEMEFSNFLKTDGRNTEFEFWGVRNQRGELIAYAQNKIQNDCCNFQVIKLDPKFRKLYGSYALLFTMIHHYLEERRLRYVNDGARSIRHETGIQDFLIRKFGFRRAYSNLHVEYDPFFGSIVRMAYPFRFLLGKLPFPAFQKPIAILNQEAIRRTFSDPV